ncbi:hypothetical protein V490_05476, partial [Pseudogymnoascus sp. VKM F-3557]
SGWSLTISAQEIILTASGTCSASADWNLAPTDVEPEKRQIQRSSQHQSAAPAQQHTQFQHDAVSTLFERRYGGFEAFCACKVGESCGAASYEVRLSLPFDFLS